MEDRQRVRDINNIHVLEINSDKYFIEEELKNIENFKYSCSNDSIVYNYITSPCLDKYFVNYLPRWLAPNLITAFSFIFNFLTFFVILFEVGNDFDAPISRFTCFLQFLTHMLYIILDNADGKQARRTNSASSMGLLFDHGFDVLTTCLVAFNISHIIMIGNSSLKSSLIFLCLLSGFWANVYEEYTVKFMHLGYINGADEGNIIIAVSALISSIYGVELWNIEALYEFTISELMIIFLILGTLHTIYLCISGIFKYTRSFRRVLIFLFDSFNFALSISVIYFTFYYDYKFYRKYTSLIYLLVSLTFSRITIEMQINIIANRNYRINQLVLFTNIVWLASIFFENSVSFYIEREYILLVLNFINLISFVNFVIKVLNEIKCHLRINIFTIKEKSDYK